MKETGDISYHSHQSAHFFSRVLIQRLQWYYLRMLRPHGQMPIAVLVHLLWSVFIADSVHLLPVRVTLWGLKSTGHG